MIGYSHSNIFRSSDIQLMRRCRRLVAEMPEIESARCHEVVRVVAGACSDVKVVDGKFGPVEHSWLVTEHAIIDCYSVGSLPMVKLVDPYLIGGVPYVQGPDRTDIDENMIRVLMRFE